MKLARTLLSVMAGSAAIVGLGSITPAKAITITPTSDAATLANTIKGSGVTLSNIKYKGGSQASGTFSDGLASGIGIDKGIILTTGSAASAPGPNKSDSVSVNSGSGGDSDLDALGFSTTNASVLEFDFTTTTSDLFFNYVFASEEYNEYVNSNFNDVFAFFLNGKNIALIPGTNTPVSINSVNGGNPFGKNASNSQFFNNNDLSDGGPFFNIQYDGFTDVFTAKAVGLAPGTHHIKLAIADVGDTNYDSAVFVQAGTFSGVPPTAVPEPTTILGTLAFSALGGRTWLKRKNKKQA